jgi:hypothetical protein
VPYVGPERGAFQHRCRDVRRSAFREVVTYINVEPRSFSKLYTYELIDKACGNLFTDVYDLNYYSRVKWLQMLDVTQG